MSDDQDWCEAGCGLIWAAVPVCTPFPLLCGDHGVKRVLGDTSDYCIDEDCGLYIG